MQKGLCVYPGSFDPITCGHLDLIERATQIFPRVLVTVLGNPSKRNFFSKEKRQCMLQKVCSHLPTVETDTFDGLLVDYMAKVNAGVVLRGLRAVTDFESEFMMAQVNHQISLKVETLFLMTAPQYAYISSSVVREVGSLGGDISSFIPACILEEVSAGLQHLRT